VATDVHYVTCVAKVPNTGDSIAPCATVGEQSFVPAVVTGVLVPSSQGPAIDAIAAVNTGTIDYSSIGAAWAASFCLTVLCWITAKQIGLILSLLKSRG
jgi:hypothetical protein